MKALIASLIAIGLLFGYFYAANRVLDWLLPDAGEGDTFISRDHLRELIRPWVFLFPALLLLTLYLIYPMIETTRLSFMGTNGRAFVGLENIRRALRDSQFSEALGNNVLWLIFVPALSLFFGLLIALLADNIRWGGIAKSFIFMPMSISFVGASVIWKFIYNINPNIGLLNAVIVKLGGQPVDVLQIPFWNNFFLMVILVWIDTGFAMVILAAALRSIPVEITESARIDGANEWQLLRYVQLPQIAGMVFVIWTTICIDVLKVFDIVAAMTNGNWKTQVMANMMFDQRFRALDTGYASFLALVIMLAVIPIMMINIRRFRREDQLRG